MTRPGLINGFFVRARSPRDPSRKRRPALIAANRCEDDGQSYDSIEGPCLSVEPRDTPPYPLKRKTYFFLSSAVILDADDPDIQPRSALMNDHAQTVVNALNTAGTSDEDRQEPAEGP